MKFLRLFHAAVRTVSAMVLASAVAAGAQAAPVNWQDNLGRTVTVNAPVKRAIIFSTYEMIPALGLWGQVIGVGRHAFRNDLMLAARPNIEREYLSAGSGMDVNIEAVLKARPDLVITWSIKPEAVRFLEQRGLTVAAVHPEGIEQLHEAIRYHGRVFGREARANQVVAESRRLFGIIEKRVQSIPHERRKRVLWLSSKPTIVAGGTGMYDDLVKAIGAVNPASQYHQRYVEVSMEKILAWNPDVIFIWGSAKYTVSDILNNPQWRHLRAVRTRQVFKAPSWSTLSPRAASAALVMAAQVYPDRFAKTVVEKELGMYYRRVFGLTRPSRVSDACRENDTGN